MQTIRQLLPPAIFREAMVDDVAWTLPAVRIEDAPRFAWRGAHLDVSRHFMPKAFVKKYIEMPGHSVAAIAAYPELGVTGEPAEVATIWGVHDNILNPTDATIGFMQDVLTEVMELFPSPFIHVGGDEATKTRWKASPAVQARLREPDLQNEEQLQGWFMTQIDAFLTERGRRMVGWDEILEGGIAAARAGHDVVMTPTRYTYFDYYESEDRDAEPLAIGGFLPLERVYGYDPVPAELEPEFATHVLGAQGQLWT